MNIPKILENIKSDLYENQKLKNCQQFMQSSVIHFAISLEIGIKNYIEEKMSYENLCINIPKKFGSRSTIQSILNDGVDKGYFLKKTSIKDKRVKTYELSEEYERMIESWIKYHEKNIKN
tara:strand:+ start:165 stop:524 length:360 start_codon:yes stop_codon:yes gene_type:complete